MSGLTELFLEQLGTMVHVENLLIKALPRMAECSRSDELRELFEEHFEETKKQLIRVQRVFKGFGIDAREKKCDSMLALLADIRAGRLATGLVGAVGRAATVLTVHFPPRPRDRNELPNDLILL